MLSDCKIIKEDIKLLAKSKALSHPIYIINETVTINYKQDLRIKFYF